MLPKKAHLSVFFLVLVVVTACTVSFFPPYINTGDNLLSTPEVENSDVVVKDGVSLLHNGDASKSVSMSYTLANGLGLQKLRLGASLKSDNVVGGEKPWNRARLLLVQYVGDKPQYSTPHTVTSLVGTTKRQEYSKVFFVFPATTSVKVIAQLSRSTGYFEVGELGLYRVVDSTLFLWAKRLVLTGWGLFFLLFLFVHLHANKSTLLKIVFALVGLLIILGTSMPGEMKEKLKSSVIEVATAEVAPIKTAVQDANLSLGLPHLGVDITKIAHFVLFGMFVVGLSFCNPVVSVGGILLNTAMLAVGTEMVQFFVEGRSPLVTDVGIDMAGAITGLGVVGLLRLFFRRD